MKNRTVYVFIGFCIFGLIDFCQAVGIDTLGVKGDRLRDGFYYGVSADGTYNQESAYRSVPRGEAGYIFLKTNYPSQTLFETSISLTDPERDFSKLAIAGGPWYLQGGYELHSMKDIHFHRYHYQVPFLPVVWSHFIGDISKKEELDIHFSYYLEERPYELRTADFAYSMGQRLSWYEGGKGSAFFGSMAWVYEEKKGDYRRNTRIFEMSFMIDDSSLYGWDDYDFKVRIAFSIQFFV